MPKLRRENLYVNDKYKKNWKFKSSSELYNYNYFKE